MCVDYGCGSLRIGQHVIRFLDPGNYWGLDITDRFMNDGVELLGPELMAERRPNLRVIAPETLREARDARADFVFGIAVLIHVAPEELDDFIDELMTVMVPGTTAFLSFKAADDVLRYAGRSWAYPEPLIEAALRRRGATTHFDMQAADTTGDDSGAGPTRRGWLTIRRETDPGA